MRRATVVLLAALPACVGAQTLFRSGEGESASTKKAFVFDPESSAW